MMLTNCTNSFVHLFFFHTQVLDDGFSRRNQSELADALQWAVQSFQEADHAARLGGSLGVSLGADFGIGSDLHNTWMYSVCFAVD